MLAYKDLVEFSNDKKIYLMVKRLATKVWILIENLCQPTCKLYTASSSTYIDRVHRYVPAITREGGSRGRGAIEGSELVPRGWDDGRGEAQVVRKANSLVKVGLVQGAQPIS